MRKKSTITPLYVLKLYIAGASPNSVRAINNTKNICEKYLKGKYELDIIDVHQQPSVAKSAQVVAIPLLIKLSPDPVKRLIGNMSDTEKVLRALAVDEYVMKNR
ncbi:MAG TPA: circadian clock KaiB family protein [Ferruginibacter sp.]|jgi:circadian clock protein KaiB|nr:circadian clock KaiB family protein [Ferruginibacter sp.]